MKRKLLTLSLVFILAFFAPNINEARDINLLTDGSPDSMEYYGKDTCTCMEMATATIVMSNGNSYTQISLMIDMLSDLLYNYL